MFLKDSFQRKFSYLRLSVTEKCNFKCEYCLPNGFQEFASNYDENELTINEIKNLVTAFASLGVTKVRLTGGEPTVRRDIVEIVDVVSRINGIEDIALTTNGFKLPQLALSLRTAGLNKLNISLDSLNKNKFNKIVGGDKFESVMMGIETALSLKFNSIKLNAVLTAETTEDEVQLFLNYIKNKPISVRFIELMKTEKNSEFFKKNHINAGALKLFLQKNDWKIMNKKSTDGPAIVYRHNDYEGSIGIIAPYTEGFCEDCNRLRVTSVGGLRLCLFGENDYQLRDLLQNENHSNDLINRIQSAVLEKPESHFLKYGIVGKNTHFAQIGG